MEHSSRTAIDEVRRSLKEMGREDVTVVAVSKTHGPERIDELAALGIRDFGENRFTEARDKFPEVRYRNESDPLIYHHIGPLQSGFARNLPGLFHRVHGASSISALEKLARAALKYAGETAVSSVLWPMEYLIQIRLTGEETKLGGMHPDEFLSLDTVPENEALQFRGFMTMGPESQDPIETREVFHRLRELRDKSLPGGELSMGMSGDWKIAVEEGATIIRLGSVLFGPRKGEPWKKD
ncbi:MAG: YggS family pyridoxal phosphate-dependent enzyme [Spirochaetaceae bacterium]|nr:YggS family pyridoxal phosphate-dependent enzyme [Spirochaetaceae bacterium]|tara:strand:+ start:19459 stop:20175 length:717 start_codon:yes stop_codon:yes gene_type:complete